MGRLENGLEVQDQLLALHRRAVDARNEVVGLNSCRGQKLNRLLKP